MGNTDSSASTATAAAAPQQSSRPTFSIPSSLQQQAPVSPLAPPGAYKMPGQPRNQRFYVTIPRGVRPGQHFAVLVNGQQMMVRCPEGNRQGDRLIVTAPRQQSQQYVVTVPTNVRPGQQFRVMINSQEVMVTCPRGVRSGQRVTFQLPQQDRAPQAAPNHQMFEVTVPDGVRAGQPFALIANGQRVMVTCPPNVKPGQKIRFQLPIQLSQQQLEAIKVNYDKDGWMRCLGQDLKFHWVYNKSETSRKEEHKIPFDIDSTAFVRELITGADGNLDTRFISATEYSMETSVKGTNVNYQELSSVAQMPFQQKVEWMRNQFSALRTSWEDGHIKIKIRRSSALQDAMDAIESIDVADMKKIFRFEFIGEPALDAGGVAREFYSIICEQIFNPDCGLFLYSSVNQMCMQINPNSGIANEFHLRYFHMVGRLLGKALMDGQITPVHLVQPLYKHLMGWPITLRDLEHIDDQIYRNLCELLSFDDVGVLYLEFVITEDHLGVTETVELIAGGSEKTVDNDNLPQYLEAQLRYRMMVRAHVWVLYQYIFKKSFSFCFVWVGVWTLFYVSSRRVVIRNMDCNISPLLSPFFCFLCFICQTRVKAQIVELLRGFYDVVPEPLVSVFDFQELELLLHGLPNIDMDDWVKNSEYTGEFAGQPSHKVVQWFWDIVRGFEQVCTHLFLFI